MDNGKIVLNIDLKLDNVEEIPIIEFEEPLIERVEETPTVEREESVNDIFDYNTKTNSYMTYRVYIVRENDTVDSIVEKYQITKEELAKYNILNNISIGDKLIIPNEKNK